MNMFTDDHETIIIPSQPGEWGTECAGSRSRRGFDFPIHNVSVLIMRRIPLRELSVRHPDKPRGLRAVRQLLEELADRVIAPLRQEENRKHIGETAHGEAG